MGKIFELDYELDRMERYVLTEQGDVVLKRSADISRTDWVVGSEQNRLRPPTRLEELTAQLDRMGGVYVVNEQGRVVQTVQPTEADRLIKRNMPRPERLQSHLHIIVSRMAKGEQRMSLSPLANGRGSKKHQLNGQHVDVGFDRGVFAQKAETQFDLQFNHERGIDKSLTYHLRRKGCRRGISGNDRVGEKILDHLSKKMGAALGEPVGISQLRVMLVQRRIAKEANKKEADWLRFYLNGLNPALVGKKITQQLDNISELKMLDNIPAKLTNLPAAMAQRLVRQMLSASVQGMSM